MSYDPNARRDTPLALKLKERIKREGLITVADYMQACLHDPEFGYYVKQPAIGRDGDFITAPEISQIFGELIGLWCAVVWQQMGSPEKVNLIELGPGRGTLMRDALRAASKVPGFVEAISVHLVETSHHLQAVQRETLAACHPSIMWHQNVRHLPTEPAIVIANEFLDTLPLHQSILNSEVWVERGVGLDAHGDLQFQSLPQTATRNERFADAPNGSVFEGQNWRILLHELRKLAREVPLTAIFIDYGHAETALGDTLQAVRRHSAEHPLTSPGEADLTAQVDFSEFAEHVSALDFIVDGPTIQAEFLGRLGIIERASRLMSANPAKAAEIEMAVARLIAPQGMGTRFKVLGVRSAGLPPLPGFSA